MANKKEEINFTPRLINKIYSKLPNQLQMMFALMDKQSVILLIIGIINAWEEIRQKEHIKVKTGE